MIAAAVSIETFVATEHQLDSVTAIESVSAATPWTRNQFAEEVANPHAWWGLARSGATIVGFVGLHQVIDEGHIVNIAVDPLWRRKRIAMRLLLAAFDEGWARAILAMTLEVRGSAISAQRLYHRFGFVPTGIRPHYYPSTAELPAEDAVIMWTEPLAYPDQEMRLARVRAELKVSP